MVRFFVSLALFAVVLSAASAQNKSIPETPEQVTAPHIIPARFRALGGMHPAIADDFYTLFSNPAGVANLERRLSILAISAAVPDVATFVPLYGGSSDNATLAGDIHNPYPLNVETGGPLALGYINRFYGFGIFNATRLRVTPPDPGDYLVTMELGEEIQGALAFAFRRGDVGNTTLDFGIMGKIFYRGVYWDNLTVNEVRHFTDDLSVHKFRTETGFGVDVGLRVAWYERFALGVAVHDIFTPVTIDYFENQDAFNARETLGSASSRAYTTVNLGMALTLREPALRYDSTINFLLNFDGLSEFLKPAEERRDLMLGFGAGLEITLLGNFTLRVGLNDMLPAAGVGFRFGAVTLNISAYGEEFGLTPGAYSGYSGAFGISVQL